LALASAAVFSVAIHAHASNGAWNGSADSYWTNSLNWSASPFPSGTQTATFDSGGSGRTEIDVAGLSIIKGITFTSAGAAAYTVGAGGARAQTLVATSESIVKLDASAANSQVFNANVQLGPDQGATTNIFQNDSLTRTLTVAGNLLSPASGGTIGYKNIFVTGAGETRLLGNIIKSYVVIIYANGAGTLTLSGSNFINRLEGGSVSSVPCHVDIGSGYLHLDNGWYPIIAYQDTVIDGAGILRISPTAANLAWCWVANGKTLTINPAIRCTGGLSHVGGNGTLVLSGLNDFASNIVFNSSGVISVAKVGNVGSLTSNLGQGKRVVFNTSGATLLYTGAGETSDRVLELNSSATLDHSGTGTLVFSANAVVGGTVKTLALQGSTAGVGEIAGAIGPGSAATSLSKKGSGTWRLSGANTYAGATTVSNGTLVLTGASGTAASSSGFAVSPGCTLQLSNAVGANHTDRLGDTAPVSLNGATLSFSHTGGAADYSETSGPLTIGAGMNTVVASQADELRTSSMTFDSLVHSVGTIDFTGTGLGESSRNRIFISKQADGLIGPWATVNGSRLAAYSSTLGVYAASDAVYTDFAARGTAPDSVITNDASVAARINLPGTSGPMTLAGAWSNSVRMILQNTAIDATVATRDGSTHKTLLTEGVLIATDKAALTIGESAGDGLLMALAPGGDLLLANDSTNVSLTVNAVVTNNTGTSSLTKSGAGNVTLAGAARYTGATALNAGTLTLSSTATQTLSGAISGGGSLAKTGAGVLRLGGNNSYAGTTLIGAGTVIADHSNALGPNGAGTIIASGATLEVGGSLAANALRLGTETITVSGTGVDGKGAIVNSSTINEQRVALYGSKVSLAADAAFGGNLRFGWWPDTLTPLLDLNGYTLSKISSNVLSIINVDVNPGSGNIELKEGNIWLTYSTRLNGSAANFLTVSNDARMIFYDLVTPPTWTLALNNRSRLALMSGAVPLNAWDGPVTLNGTAFLDGNANAAYSLKVNGPISGVGPLVKIDTMTAYLTHTNNTYNGNTIVSNGVLTVAHAGSLPGYGTAGRVTVAPAATLAAMTGSGTAGWSKAQLDTLRTTTAFVATNSALGLDTSFGDFVYDSDIAYAYTLAKLGTNTLTCAGSNTINTLRVQAGALTLTGKNAISTVRVQAGTLTLGNTSTNAVNAVLVTGSQGTAMNVDGPLTLVNFGSVTNGAASGDRCVMRVTTNLTIMAPGNSSPVGKLFLGNGAGAAGALYHTAGLVSVSSGKQYTDFLSIGTGGGYGYYRMTGGTLVCGEIGITGSAGGSNVGVFDLYGGTVNNDGAHLVVGWSGGIGVLNMYGGSIAITTYLYNTLSAASSIGIVNLLGPTAALSMKSTSTTAAFVEMASANGNRASVINLNSGVLIANRVYATFAGTPSFFNFNGGTLRANSVQTNFFQGLSLATVYPGGAVIDSSNMTVTVNQPLLAPTGYGVAGIALNGVGTGYIGAPAVQITGGSGTNATAVAEVDLAEGSLTKGQVTGIKITSPGTGYLAGDALTVTLSGGGYLTTAVTGSVTKALNVSGGLTKLGTGTLTLGATNTYAGATVISNGTLRLGNALALPTATTVVLAGGTLDLNGFTVTNTLAGSSGTVSNGTMQTTISPAGAGLIGSVTLTPGTATLSGTYLADVTVSGTNDFLTVQGAFNLSTFSLQLVNPAMLSPGNKVYTLAKVTGARTGAFLVGNLVLPDSRWHVVYSTDGSVKLAFSNGTLFMMR
jgi:autotransporter-associated beta strand protein